MSNINCRSCRYCVNDLCLNDEIISKIGFASSAKNNRALLSLCGPDAKYFESFSDKMPPKVELIPEDFKHFDKETWLKLFEYYPLLRLSRELFNTLTSIQKSVDLAKLSEKSRINSERLYAVWDDDSKLDEILKLLKRSKNISKKFDKLIEEDK